MPTLPDGPLEGVEYHRWKTTRENDDAIVIYPELDPVAVLRSSIGGNEEMGYYHVFRGEPEEIVKMLEMALEVTKAIVAGTTTYEDNRT